MADCIVNGLMRAAESDISLVVADGDRTRYQGGMHYVHIKEAILATWVVPQDFRLVPYEG